MADDDLDDIFVDTALEDEDDEETAIIRKALQQQMADDDDDAGLDQPPLEDPEVAETVGIEEAAQLASDANLKGKYSKSSDDAPKAETKPEDTKPEDTKPEEPDETSSDDELGDISQASVSDLIKDLPDTHRAEVAKRIRAADDALQPFQSPYAQSQLSHFGATPAQMSERLIRIATHAHEDPADYLAWAIESMASEKGKEFDVLSAAAEKLNLKISKREDDDLFEDPETQALRRENEELRAANGMGKIKGPDSPERQHQEQARRDYLNFVNETDESGNLKRPHYATLRPMIEQAVKNFYDQTGQRVNVTQLDEFYNQASQQMMSSFGGNSAAQQPTPVPQPSPQQQAATLSKSKAASKNIDGAGQGAPRRPVQSDDIEDVIRAAIKSQISA
jgi:hypothetical protein